MPGVPIRVEHFTEYIPVDPEGRLALIPLKQRLGSGSVIAGGA
jgi:hypothetical protein